MVLENVELVEMMRVAEVPKAASFDKGMDRDDDGRGRVRDEEPRCSAAGKHCAAPSDRSSATLGKETPAIEQRGSTVLDRAFPRVGGVALGVVFGVKYFSRSATIIFPVFERA